MSSLGKCFINQNSSQIFCQLRAFLITSFLCFLSSNEKISLCRDQNAIKWTYTFGNKTANSLRKMQIASIFQPLSVAVLQRESRECNFDPLQYQILCTCDMHSRGLFVQYCSFSLLGLRGKKRMEKLQ